VEKEKVQPFAELRECANRKVHNGVKRRFAGKKQRITDVSRCRAEQIGKTQVAMLVPAGFLFLVSTWWPSRPIIVVERSKKRGRPTLFPSLRIFTSTIASYGRVANPAPTISVFSFRTSPKHMCIAHIQQIQNKFVITKPPFFENLKHFYKIVLKKKFFV